MRILFRQRRSFFIMEIALITPTRDRKDQLSLVIDCINNQTLDADMWVIADDGPEPVPQEIIDKIRLPHKYIHYRSGLSKSGSGNFAKALEAVTAKKYLKIDDDDYYPPTYVEHFSSLLTEENSVVGDKRWTDYRLSTGYYRERIVTDDRPEGNKSGFTGEKLKADIVSWLNNNKTNCFEDIGLHGGVYKPKHYPVKMYDFGEHSNVALKDYGVGSKGQISQHFSNSDMKPDDDSFSYFKKRLGADWVRYERYLGRLRQSKKQNKAEIVKEYKTKKVSDYLDTGLYKKVLIKFHHGLGDAVMFQPCYEALKNKYPDIKFYLHTHLGQEALFGSCDDNVSLYDIIFEISFPCSEWSGGKYTKAEYCCIQELGIVPKLGDPFLDRVPSPLVGVHFISTCCSSLCCNEDVAKRLHDQIMSSGLIPINTHMEHPTADKNKPIFSWDTCSIRDSTATCENLLGVLSSCSGFAGVASGNFQLASAIMPEDVLLYIKTDFSVKRLTHKNILELDAKNYDESVVARWINNINKHINRPQTKPPTFIQDPTINVSPTTLQVSERSTKFRKIKTEKTITFVTRLSRANTDIRAIYNSIRSNFDSYYWLVYVDRDNIQTVEELKLIGRHDKNVFIDRSIKKSTQYFTEAIYAALNTKRLYETQWLYVLDDDTIVHPALSGVLSSIPDNSDLIINNIYEPTLKTAVGAPNDLTKDANINSIDFSGCVFSTYLLAEISKPTSELLSSGAAGLVRHCIENNANVYYTHTVAGYHNYLGRS